MLLFLLITIIGFNQSETRNDRVINSRQVAEILRVKKSNYCSKYKASGEDWFLVRQPEKNLFHLVFQSNDTIFYAFYDGNCWSPAETIGIGKLPCISLDLKGRPWVAYLSPDNKSLYCAVRRADNSWKRMFIFGVGACGDYIPEYIGQPSMVHNIYPEEPPMAYLVCSFNSLNFGMIQFIPFDTITAFYPPPLDLGAPEDSLRNPCIGITPKDLLHIVWQRRRENTRSIYHKVTLEGVTPSRIYETQGNLLWSERTVVSTQDPLSEPASKPFVEAYGDSVFTVWRGPNEEGQDIGEIWRRARWIQHPPNYWPLIPTNWSQSGEQESDYPVMSTGNVTAWQESLPSDTWEILARVENEIINISNTPSSHSRYPHIITNLGSPITPERITIDAIWTEEIEPDTFEVMYRHIELPCTSVGPYYSVNVGESIPSPYLEGRDGYLQYGQYKIDYGRHRLIYRLPYFHPSFNYIVRAIVFSCKPGRTRQNFELDDSTFTEIEFEPFKPETVWVKIPEVAYKNDLEVRERINRLIGNYAVLADLVLYQYEEDMGGSGKGGVMGENAGLSLKPVLYNCLPNPFRSQTVIRYQLPSPALVSLRVYDITGKLIRVLVNSHQKAGDYRILWDGRDSGGRRLSNGIYFYRLKTGDFESIKKTILIR